MKFLKSIVALAVALLSLSTHAGVIVGGSTLLDAQGLTQLEIWLGKGQLTVTNIFTKDEASTAIDFHKAADGKGATFFLMSASEDGSTWKTVGGYNPESWTSLAGYTIENDSSKWSAFIFNLTDKIKKNQTQPYTAFNLPAIGPAFGRGHDLYVSAFLASGYSYGYSYGGITETSIVDGLAYDGVAFQVAALEVFTVAPYVQTVPEPSSTAILSLGVMGLYVSRRRAAKKSNVI